MKPSYVRGSVLAFLFVLLWSAVPALAHDQPNKTGILLVAFGTTVPEARAALHRIEDKAKQRFPETEIRWAYTSRLVRQTLANEDVKMDSPATALARMMDEGFTHVAVQSLHTIPGEEFESLRQTVNAFPGLPKGMKQVTLGVPLLYTPEDVKRCAQAIVSSLPPERKKNEAVVLLGHGTPHPGNIYYPGLQYFLSRLDPLVLVGTVEGSPSLDDVRHTLKGTKARKAYLLPFMAVAGDHALNDMAGDEDASWKSVLTADGLTCVPILRGTAEIPAVAAIWLDHLQEAMNALND